MGQPPGAASRHTAESEAPTHTTLQLRLCSANRSSSCFKPQRTRANDKRGSARLPRMYPQIAYAGCYGSVAVAGTATTADSRTASVAGEGSSGKVLVNQA
jgi:hypothetical protein